MFFDLQGENASKSLEFRRRQDGTIGIDLPPPYYGEAGQYLHVVSKYQHFGGYTGRDSNVTYEAAIRAGTGTGAYTPLAFRIFGNKHVRLF